MPRATTAPLADDSYFEGALVSDPLSSLSSLAEPVTNRGKSEGLIVVFCNMLTYMLLCKQLSFSACCCKPVNINQYS